MPTPDHGSGQDSPLLPAGFGRPANRGEVMNWYTTVFGEGVDLDGLSPECLVLVEHLLELRAAAREALRKKTDELRNQKASAAERRVHARRAALDYCGGAREVVARDR